MLCNVTNFQKVERENEMPYYVLRATGVEGDDNAEAIDEDGVINPFAMMSRKFNFTKTLFPATEAQCNALEKAYVTDDEGNVQSGAKVRLMSYQWAAPAPFYIVKDESVTGVYEDETEVTEEVIKNGKKVQVVKTKYTPKVFTTVNLTLFETKDGQCAENGGNAEALCKQRFERAVADGSYLLCESNPIESQVV